MINNAAATTTADLKSETVEPGFRLFVISLGTCSVPFSKNGIDPVPGIVQAV
jgi:hypothetical protein